MHACKLAVCIWTATWNVKEKVPGPYMKGQAFTSLELCCTPAFRAPLKAQQVCRLSRLVLDTVLGSSTVHIMHIRERYSSEGDGVERG